jgi:iduronate 2-sulfatase
MAASAKPMAPPSENHRLHLEGQKLKKKKRGPAWESADVPDSVYADGLLTERAVVELRKLKDRDQIALPDNYHAPRMHRKNPFIHPVNFVHLPARGPASDEIAQNLIHGYYACVSYTDAQIGRLLDELDQMQLFENTTVVLWGDHGWNLGEHALWCKHSCYETSMQIPLIVRAPGIKGGQRGPGLVESIDQYPTLCELSGLKYPDHLQGRSFAGLMKDSQADWKTAAVGRFQKGDTIRTEEFRFTEYSDAAGKRTSAMLYDHAADSDENVNVLKSRQQVVTQVTKQLHRIKVSGRN